ncbi:MAG TPA: hypothetical protein VFJ43_00850 [Bacteroidia bacterium]|nr:hypothetical protein [Bacteroidia bacterium]
MKTVFAFIIIFLSSYSLFGQDTSVVVNHYGDGKIYDTYKRNAAGEKEGDYIQYNHFGKKYITGQYKNGVPVGIWNYYSSDTSAELVEKLDFDQHKELFVDSNRVHSLICGPRYFGGTKLEKEYVAMREKYDFTEEEKKLYRGKTFIVSFTIDDKTYKAIGIAVDDNTIPEPIKSKLMKIAADMPAWLPPVCKDKSEVWRFSIPVTIK